MKPSILSVFVATASIAFAACSSDGAGDGGDEGASGEAGAGGTNSSGGASGASSGSGGKSTGGSSSGGTAGSGGSSGAGGSGQSGSGGAPVGCTEHYNEGFVPNQMCPVTGGQQGEYVDGPCPTEGALGYCNYNQSNGAIRFGLYTYQEDAVSIAMGVCTSTGGSWCEI